MLDNGVFTDLVISAKIVNIKKDKLFLLINILIPVDHNIVEKENDKLSKCRRSCFVGPHTSYANTLLERNLQGLLPRDSRGKMNK